MKTAADKKRKEFMAWVSNHPEIKDISKHLVADFLNQYNASCARLALIRENNQLEVISEFGFDNDDCVLGEIYESHQWQNTDDEVFMVVAGIAPTAWLEGSQIYVVPLKVNSVNIGYAQIVFSKPVSSQHEIEHLLEDLSIGLSLYLGYQNELNKYYRKVEELANTLRLKESNSALKMNLLTPRQRGILELMAQELTNDEIAHNLGFSHSTIQAESSEIYRILQVSGRKGAVSALKFHLSPMQAQINKPII